MFYSSFHLQELNSNAKVKLTINFLKNINRIHSQWNSFTTTQVEYNSSHDVYNAMYMCMCVCVYALAADVREWIHNYTHDLTICRESFDTTTTFKPYNGSLKLKTYFLCIALI